MDLTPPRSFEQLIIRKILEILTDILVTSLFGDSMFCLVMIRLLVSVPAASKCFKQKNLETTYN